MPGRRGERTIPDLEHVTRARSRLGRGCNRACEARPCKYCPAMGLNDQFRAWSSLTYSASEPYDLDATTPEAMNRAINESLEIIQQHLGSAWLEREFLGVTRAQRSDLGFDEDPDWIGPIPLMRLGSLANELHEARSIPGFAAFVKGLRARSMLDATAEMWAVRQCNAVFGNVRFVDPHSGPGRTPDAITVLDGIEVAIEVKARAELPLEDYNSKKILSTLGSARGQLPKSGPSLIYLRISPPWSEDQETLISIGNACASFLRNSRRVNAVVLLLERRLPHPDGGGMAFKIASVAVLNDNPRVWIPGIQHLFLE